MKVGIALIFMLWHGPLLGQPETLESLWARLQRSSLAIKEAELRVQRDSYSLAAQRGSYTPQISLESRISHSRETLADDRIEGVNKRLSAKAEQIIFDRESLTAIDIRKLREEMSKAELLHLKDRLLRELALAYYDVLEKEASLKLLRERLDGPVRTLEEQAYRALKEGVRSAQQISPLLLELNQLRLKKSQLESSLRLSRLHLNDLVNEPIDEITALDPTAGIRLQSLPEPGPVPEEAIEDFRTRMKEAEVARVNTKFWPYIALYGQWDFQADSGVAPVRNPENSTTSRSEIGLVLTIPIWSGLGTYHEGRAAESDRDATKAEIKAARTRRTMFIESGARQLDEDFARYQDATRLAKIAEDLLAQARKQQNAGMASFDALLGPEIQLLQMSLVRIESFFSFFKSEATELSRRGALSSRLFGHR